MRMWRRAIGGFLVLASALAIPGAQAAPADYPTADLAEYIFGCMATNGQTPETMRRCACSIDYIAGRLDHESYVQAETVLRMRQLPGGEGRALLFRASPRTQEMVDLLRRAQVEAEFACF
jgi:hypothetical protein